MILSTFLLHFKYNEYLEKRGEVAIPRGELLPMSTEDQICETFGVHPQLPTVQELCKND